MIRKCVSHLSRELPQLLHVASHTKKQTKVGAEGTDVCSSLTLDMDNCKVALLVELEQFGVVDCANLCLICQFLCQRHQYTYLKRTRSCLLTAEIRGGRWKRAPVRVSTAVLSLPRLEMLSCALSTAMYSLPTRLQHIQLAGAEKD